MAIHTDLRQAYAAAAAEVGENKALKKAVYAAYIKAEQTVLGACAKGYGPVLEAAQQAVRTMLTEQSPIRPHMKINGRPQSVPESSGSIEHRFRLFYESARCLPGDPLTQPSASGHLLGQGSGLEQLVSALTPLFQRKQTAELRSVIRPPLNDPPKGGWRQVDPLRRHPFRAALW